MNFVNRRGLAEHLTKDPLNCAVAVIARGPGVSALKVAALNDRAVSAAEAHRKEGLGRWRRERPAFRGLPSRPPSDFETQVLPHLSDPEAQAVLIESDYSFFGRGSRGHVGPVGPPGNCPA